MTSDGLREPRRAAAAGDGGDGRGHGHGHGHGPRSGDRPATVTVMPLWARFRAGVDR